MHMPHPTSCGSRLLLCVLGLRPKVSLTSQSTPSRLRWSRRLAKCTHPDNFGEGTTEYTTATALYSRLSRVNAEVSQSIKGSANGHLYCYDAMEVPSLISSLFRCSSFPERSQHFCQDVVLLLLICIDRSQSCSSTKDTCCSF